jgi:hypothetical protein
MKEFSQSEIKDYTTRYRRAIDLSIDDPLVDIRSMILAIPKGMIRSYPDTISVLVKLLTDINYTTIPKDLKAIEDNLKNPDNISTIAPYSASDFSRDKTLLSGLFTQAGLIHKTGEVLFNNKQDIHKVESDLLTLTNECYPLVFDIKTILKYLEEAHDRASDVPEHMPNSLLSVGYRLSIFSVVVDNIQAIEHNFVQCLESIRKRSLRNK